MNYNRRKFIQLSAGASAGVLLTSSLGMRSCGNSGKSMNEFGLQLWTLRDDLPKDPKGVLRQIASYGYKQIESFEGAQGMFWGMSNTQFKSYMDELGMKIIASHCNIDQDFEKKAAEAAAIGMKYLICPWKGPQKSIDDFKRFAADFNQRGEVCKRNGIRFAYHNHDYSFKAIDGQIPQVVMMDNTDPALVDYEMDMYWVAAAGESIEGWLSKYKNRFRLCHIKDRSKNPGPDNGKNSVVLGTGSLDWPTILKAAKANGMQYYIVEQEAYEGTTPLKAVEANAAYLKTLSI